MNTLRLASGKTRTRLFYQAIRKPMQTHHQHSRDNSNSDKYSVFTRIPSGDCDVTSLMQTELDVLLSLGHKVPEKVADKDWNELKKIGSVNGRIGAYKILHEAEKWQEILHKEEVEQNNNAETQNKQQELERRKLLALRKSAQRLILIPDLISRSSSLLSEVKLACDFNISQPEPFYLQISGLKDNHFVSQNVELLQSFDRYHHQIEPTTQEFFKLHDVNQLVYIDIDGDEEIGEFDSNKAYVLSQVPLMRNHVKKLGIQRVKLPIHRYTNATSWPPTLDVFVNYLHGFKNGETWPVIFGKHTPVERDFAVWWKGDRYTTNSLVSQIQVPKRESSSAERSNEPKIVEKKDDGLDKSGEKIECFIQKPKLQPVRAERSNEPKRAGRRKDDGYTTNSLVSQIQVPKREPFSAERSNEPKIVEKKDDGLDKSGEKIECFIQKPKLQPVRAERSNEPKTAEKSDDSLEISKNPIKWFVPPSLPLIRKFNQHKIEQKRYSSRAVMDKNKHKKIVKSKKSRETHADGCKKSVISGLTKKSVESTNLVPVVEHRLKYVRLKHIAKYPIQRRDLVKNSEKRKDLFKNRKFLPKFRIVE